MTARLESEAPPGATRGLTPVVRSYEDVVVGDVRLTLFVLFTSVGAVLLIASANHRPLARPRFDAFVLSVFGSAVLMLAAIGLYAVMGAYVRQRDTEMGIRVALGATASDVRRLVVGEGLWLAGLGAVMGLAGAVATTRLLRGLLFGVHPLDAVSMLAAVLLVAGASALASYLPASRAARIDPLTLLRAG